MHWVPSMAERTGNTQRPPSIMEVAKLAQVSHQTVSRVINGHPGVRPTTRQHVLEAIDTLGYRRNSAARALVTQHTGLIGVIAVGSFLFGPTSTITAIDEAARNHGYTVLLSTLKEAEDVDLTAAIDHALGQGVEAVIIIASREALVRRAAELSTGVPFLIVGPSPVDVKNLTTLSVDQDAGSRKAIDYLVGLGHQALVLLAGPQDWTDAQLRLSAARDQCERHGVSYRVYDGDWTATSGYQVATRLVEDRSHIEDASRPTALFSANDQMALGVLSGLNAAGINVPGEVSVVGFDNVAGSDFFTPALTTVEQDFTQLGHRVVRATLAMLAGEQPDLAPVPAKLLVRASTARAPRADVELSGQSKQ